MDSALQATMTAELTDFGAGIISVIGVVLPVAFGIAVTLTGLVVGIRWFRKIAGV